MGLQEVNINTSLTHNYTPRLKRLLVWIEESNPVHVTCNCTSLEDNRFLRFEGLKFFSKNLESRGVANHFEYATVTGRPQHHFPCQALRWQCLCCCSNPLRFCSSCDRRRLVDELLRRSLQGATGPIQVWSFSSCPEASLPGFQFFKTISLPAFMQTIWKYHL